MLESFTNLVIKAHLPHWFDIIIFGILKYVQLLDIWNNNFSFLGALCSVHVLEVVSAQGTGLSQTGTSLM